MENTETLKIIPRGNGFQIVVEHDQTGSSYDMTISKEVYRKLNLHFVGSNNSSWRDKLITLMTSLEMQNVSKFMGTASKEDYRILGERMATLIKELKTEKK